MDKRKMCCVVVIAISLLAVIALGLGLGLGLKKDDNSATPSKRSAGSYDKAAVATDAEECSKIGRDVLKAGGHAVDAAIAALICTGVANLHSTGIAGGGFMTIYDKSKNESVMYDYREVGPASLTETSFDDGSDKYKVGGLSVGVPAELRGLNLAHKKYGKLTWTRLIQPSIDLAESGISINKHMHGNMISSKKYIEKDPGLTELLMKDGKLLEIRSIIKNPKYAESLRQIQANYDDLNTGNLSTILLKDVNANGGNITADDLKNYQVKVKQPIKIKLTDKLTLHTSSLPGGGSVLAHILNMVEGMKLTKEDDIGEKKILMYHKIVESFKFSYAMRPHLGDPDFVPDASKKEFEQYKMDINRKANATIHRQMINDTSTQENSYYDPYFVTTEDEGTTHVSVLDEQGNAVSATDTINYAFGSKLRSMESGIIYNNELADFFRNDSYKTGSNPNVKYYPRAVINAPGPGKRPLSSTCPSIITDENNNVLMVVGGSGGTRITLSTAWVIIKKLWLGYSLSDAVEDARPQHTFFPEFIRNENGAPLSQEIVDGLRAKNHRVSNSKYNAIVQGIFVENGKIFAKSDPRKEGKAAGY